jgi:hypothetical protein
VTASLAQAPPSGEQKTPPCGQHLGTDRTRTRSVVEPPSIGPAVAHTNPPQLTDSARCWKVADGGVVESIAFRTHRPRSPTPVGKIVPACGAWIAPSSTASTSNPGPCQRGCSFERRSDSPPSPVAASYSTIRRTSADDRAACVKDQSQERALDRHQSLPRQTKQATPAIDPVTASAVDAATVRVGGDQRGAAATGQTRSRLACPCGPPQSRRSPEVGLPGQGPVCADAYANAWRLRCGLARSQEVGHGRIALAPPNGPDPAEPAAVSLLCGAATPHPNVNGAGEVQHRSRPSRCPRDRDRRLRWLPPRPRRRSVRITRRPSQPQAQRRGRFSTRRHTVNSQPILTRASLVALLAVELMR